jgi:serine/threonine protein kinase/tetratricopeptide (TPR) repeat protein
MEQYKRKLGQYELESVIGRGGMATVWKAYQPSLDRYVAVKLMQAAVGEDETFSRRFSQEARAVARLRHSNILSVYDYGQDEKGQPYIVTELLDGGTLRDFMRKPLDIKQMGRIIGQIADALDYAHSQNMVHRDIKPSNILMGTQRVAGDRAVLADFGIVKLLSGTHLTKTGSGIGTAEYMSPEQAAGEALDGRSDEYSLAIVLYEMLTGVTPFKADEPLAIMMGHVNKPLPDPRTFNPKIPPEIVAVLKKALGKYPNERYDTVGAFAEALQQAIAVSVGTSGQASVGGTPSTPSANYTPSATPLRPRADTSTRPFFVSSAQAYDYALRQESEGNQQAAFETLTDLYRREPSYRDVATRVQEYETRKFQYTGQYTLYRPPEDHEQATMDLTATGQRQGVGDDMNALTKVVGYVPHDPTADQPPLKAGSPKTAADQPLVVTQPLAGVTPAKKPPVGVLIGAGVAVLAVVIALAALVFPGGNNNNNRTPTVQAVVSPTLGSNSTTPGATTPGATVTTPSVTTVQNLPTTAAATPTPSRKVDALSAEIEPVVRDIYQNGNLKDGVAKLKALTEKDPKSWLAQYELGRAYYWFIRDTGGLQYSQEAVKLNDQDAMAQAYLALARFDNYKDSDALGSIQVAKTLNPNSAEVKAASALTLLRSQPTLARTEAQAALQQEPDNMLAQYAAWASYVANREYGSATTQIDALIAKYKNFAIFKTSKAYQRLLQNDAKEADTLYREALAIDPDFPRAHTGLGTILRGDGKFAEAIAAYEKAIGLYKLDPNPYVGYGYALDALKRSAEAENQFRQAIKLDINNAEAYNGLAISFISRAVDRDLSPTKDVALNYLKNAVDEADKAIRLDARYADAYFQKGYALYLSDSWTEAQEPLAKAVELRKDSATYYTVQAYNFFRLNKKEDAKKAAEAALSNDPTLKEARDLLTELNK